MPRISVCIPTVRPTTLTAAVASIRRQTWTDWELIIVGQGEDAAFRDVLEPVMLRDSRVRYVSLARKGVSRARNAGLEAAQGDIVAMVDDDCEAREDWLAVLAQYFAADPEVDIIGGAILAEPPSWRTLSTSVSLIPSEARYDPASTPPPPGFDWFTANVAMRRAVAERVGPFDELLGGGAEFRSCEDIDYKLRAEGAGVKMRSTPRSVTFHHGRYHGVAAAVRYWASNGTGAGAVAAKLALRRDPRSGEWFRSNIHTQTVGFFKKPTPQGLVRNPVRLSAFFRAYRRCVRNFEVDARGVLTPRQDVGP